MIILKPRHLVKWLKHKKHLRIGDSYHCGTLGRKLGSPCLAVNELMISQHQSCQISQVPHYCFSLQRASNISLLGYFSQFKPFVDNNRLHLYRACDFLLKGLSGLLSQFSFQLCLGGLGRVYYPPWLPREAGTQWGKEQSAGLTGTSKSWLPHFMVVWHQVSGLTF